jgi:hypothetical protein
MQLANDPAAEDSMILNYPDSKPGSIEAMIANLFVSSVRSSPSWS